MCHWISSHFFFFLLFLSVHEHRYWATPTKSTNLNSILSTQTLQMYGALWWYLHQKISSLKTQTTGSSRNSRDEKRNRSIYIHLIFHDGKTQNTGNKTDGRTVDKMVSHMLDWTLTSKAKNCFKFKGNNSVCKMSFSLSKLTFIRHRNIPV